MKCLFLLSRKATESSSPSRQSSLKNIWKVWRCPLLVASEPLYGIAVCNKCRILINVYLPERSNKLLCVHVLNVHVLLKKWNLESWFSAKPCFMRLVVSPDSWEHFKHLSRSGWTGQVSSLVFSVDSPKAWCLCMTADVWVACLGYGCREFSSWLSLFLSPPGQMPAYKVWAALWPSGPWHSSSPWDAPWASVFLLVIFWRENVEWCCSNIWVGTAAEIDV